MISILPTIIPNITHLIQFNTKIRTMQSLNLAAYHDKISNIRNKILTKHRETPIQSSNNYSKPETSYPTTLPYHKQAVDVHVRAPLQQKCSNQPYINDRLKELDSVNDKIKRILGTKRQSSVISKHHTPTKSQQIQATPKRITSLFQNESKIVESKVGILNNNLASSKQQAFEQKPYRPTSNKATIQSRLFTNERSQGYKLRQERPYAYKLENLREQKLNFQEAGIKKTSDLTFGDKNRQSLEEERPLVQHYRAEIDQNKKTVNIGAGGYHTRHQTKKLAQLLLQQISLDSKLRQSKQQFENLKDQSKWKKLKEQISAYGIQTTTQQLERWVRLSANQCDPFSQKRAGLGSFMYGEIAGRFVEAWNHWNGILKQAVWISRLEEEGFKIQEIDLDGKGYITFEDLVCFVNLNCDSFLRSRDVVCLFKRWNLSESGEKVENRLKYQTFLNFVAQ